MASTIQLPKDFDNRVAIATCSFWNVRQRQANHQGNRAAATGGKQLDGFIMLTRDILIMNGTPENAIFTDSALELPGYFRPNKKWDLLVVENNRLFAAVEFKSQVGPSFGNNFNNRTEEALGSALDLWTAHREETFYSLQAPWVGYFMLLEECEKSMTTVGIHSQHFDVRKEFQGTSYAQRYELFCRKLVTERHYSAACFMMTSQAGNGRRKKPTYSFPDERLSYSSFLSSLVAATHI